MAAILKWNVAVSLKHEQGVKEPDILNRLYCHCQQGQQQLGDKQTLKRRRQMTHWSWMLSLTWGPARTQTTSIPPMPPFLPPPLLRSSFSPASFTLWSSFLHPFSPPSLLPSLLQASLCRNKDGVMKLLSSSQISAAQRKWQIFLFAAMLIHIHPSTPLSSLSFLSFLSSCVHISLQL